MRIHLRFEENTRFSAVLVADVVEKISRKLFELERAELEQIAVSIPEVPAVAVDAALERMRSREDRILQIEAARAGSIELVLIGTALAYWLLDKTLGETISDAWKQTALRRRVRALLLAGGKQRAEAVTEALRKGIQLRSRSDPLRIEHRAKVSHEISEDGTLITIRIVEVHSITEVITYEQLAADEKARLETKSAAEERRREEERQRRFEEENDG